MQIALVSLIRKMAIDHPYHTIFQVINQVYFQWLIYYYLFGSVSQVFLSSFAILFFFCISEWGFRMHAGFHEFNFVLFIRFGLSLYIINKQYLFQSVAH